MNSSIRGSILCKSLRFKCIMIQTLHLCFDWLSRDSADPPRNVLPRSRASASSLWQCSSNHLHLDIITWVVLQHANQKLASQAVLPSFTGCSSSISFPDSFHMLALGFLNCFPVFFNFPLPGHPTYSSFLASTSVELRLCTWRF